MSSVNNYSGSMLFAGLAAKLNVPLDQVNFFVVQLVALFLAALYRKALHPSKVGSVIRHIYGLVLGFLLVFFCYGYNSLHLLALSSISYAILRTSKPQVAHILVLITSMSYLSLMHTHRIYFNYGFSGVDISGPLMVLIQKVTSLAFSVHDGCTKNETSMTELQKRFALNKVPNPLEFFSYVLLFPSILAGPVIYFKDYIDFIEGNNDSSDVDPSRTVYKKVFVSLSCSMIYLACNPHFPISRLKDEMFTENTEFSYKLWYLAVCTTLARFKYYFAWIIADGICNNGGIGFNGFDENGEAKWDKVSNVDIVDFEFATSLKDAIAAWNKGTNVWLRFIVYERAPKYKVFLTYCLSAIWHGFYPGYYITFFSGAIFTYASRIVRKNVRNYFDSNADTKKFYDICTFLVTRFVMAYVTFPFLLLEFWASIAIYNLLYWHLHVVTILTIFLVPNCFPRNLIKNEENVKIVTAFRTGSYKID